MTNTHAIAAVQRGVTFLDDQFGPNTWRSNVTKEIQMANGTRCVLSQVTGYGYTAAYSDLGLSNREAAQLGFDETDEWTYRDLDLLWARALAFEPLQEAPAAPATNGRDVEVTLTRDQLVDLVTRAMDSAPTRGDYSEIGLVYKYLSENNLL